MRLSFVVRILDHMHHQPQVVLDKLVPCAAVAGRAGQKASLLLLGAQGGREGAGIAQMQREKQEFRGEGLQQYVQHNISLSCSLMPSYARTGRGQHYNN